MSNPFHGRLPPGWTARPFDAPTQYPTFIICAEDGEVITHAQVDPVIPLEAHVQYCWQRYYQRD